MPKATNPGRYHKQHGNVMVMATIALLAIAGMAGLAADSGHAYANKTRLQNALDASALGAARVLDTTGNTAQARAAAELIFASHLAQAANNELTPVSASLETAFSNTLSPFVAGAVAPRFVRVSLSNPLDIDTSLTRVFGINQIAIDTTAIAGPSPVLGAACDIAPIVVCGNPTPPPGTFWGYTIGDPVDLIGQPGATSEVGKGNFRLLDLSGSGGDDVRENLAGRYGNCASVGGTVETKPGLTAGPFVQGVNTRFGIYAGNLSRSLYPPDLVRPMVRTADGRLVAVDADDFEAHHSQRDLLTVGSLIHDDFKSQSLRSLPHCTGDGIRCVCVSKKSKHVQAVLSRRSVRGDVPALQAELMAADTRAFRRE